MATLSTTAWVLHELGLAAGFGGNLFGQIALNPAVAEIQSKRERGKVTHVAWDRYKVVNGASLALMRKSIKISQLGHRQFVAHIAATASKKRLLLALIQARIKIA